MQPEFQAMTQVIAVVTGLSGVGKSWLLKNAQNREPMQVLSTGSLIAGQLKAGQSQSVAYDGLREQDIEANQRALERGFSQHLDPRSQLVILDAHVVIDTPNGLELIKTDVFSDIGASLVIFLEEDPSRIVQNRLQDTSRKRPLLDQNSIKAQQEVAKERAQMIASELEVPWHILRAGDIEGLLDVLLSRDGV